jgi:hypothetical protein
MSQLGILLTALALVGAACGGTTAATTIADSTTVATAAVAPTTTVAVATSTEPTTTTASTTTTTTKPPTPQELRDEFLAALDADGWSVYIDETIGWSIRYPGDWEVTVEEPGGIVWFSPPLGGSVLWVSPSLHAVEDDESSDDYLTGNVAFSVDEGLLREPEEDAWFWLDSDFDGVEGPQDVVGVQLSLAVDPTTGEAVGDDEVAPVWWYGYYDPQARPSYGYGIQTIGVSTVVFQNADWILLSFEPPDGFPTLQPPTG